ncbi:Os05g0449750 [Oryza sativa Japonica Group]|uniref:Os05g0449750 protein n=1 Tax=Oryza sativa subsp. japonica TaxID=39947 RepID=A0A0P0WN82_ORYSJ|nr:hypothetical protein EE612_029873 [Oryza sativa]BAS94317.1 Os05g0449750 [Oryza sativa Japonica Group]
MEGMVPSDSCHFLEVLKTSEQPHVPATDAPKRSTCIYIDGSENGCSNTPDMNLTLRIRSTASSIRDIGISPASTKNTRSSKNFSNLKGIIICRLFNK